MGFESKSWEFIRYFDYSLSDEIFYIYLYMYTSKTGFSHNERIVKQVSKMLI